MKIRRPEYFLGRQFHKTVPRLRGSTPVERQDRARVVFVVESTCNFDWIGMIDQPADAFDDGTIYFVGAIPRRVLDDVPKFHDDQWVVHTSLVIPSFCNEAT